MRYRSSNGGTYLVGPGGALKNDENIVQAIVRETKEETAVTVRPKRVAIIEDLVSSRFKMIKVWMICEVVGGKVRRTEGAEKEGILQAAWFTRNQLISEVVFPPALMEHDWDQLRSENWEVKCMPSRKANF